MDKSGTLSTVNPVALAQVPPIVLVQLGNDVLLADNFRFLTETHGKRAALRALLVQTLTRLGQNKSGLMVERPLIEHHNVAGEQWISAIAPMLPRTGKTADYWVMFVYPAKQWSVQPPSAGIRVWTSQLTGETLAVDGFEGPGTVSFTEDMPSFVPPHSARLLKNDLVSWLAETKGMPAGESHAARQLRVPMVDFKGTPRLSVTTQWLLYGVDGQVKAILHCAFFPAQAALVEHEKQLASTVFEAINEGIFITDREGFIIRANRAFFAMTGYGQEDIQGLHCSRLWEEHLSNGLFKTMRKTVDDGEAWRIETGVVCKNVQVKPSILSVTATRDTENQVTHYVGVLVDMAEKKQSEQRIYRLAYFDSLTEVPNRASFFERLERALNNARRADESMVVLFLDLDRFKPINDSLGHTAGDQLLKAVARRLLYCIRENDMVARVGGDEFAILLTDLSSAQEAENTAVKTAQRILSQFVSAFLIEGREVYTSTSIGIAIYPRDGQLPEELVRNSDMAMYAAKKGGKNNYHFYDSSMNVQAMERLIMESALRKALANDEFELYFQPQCDTTNGSLAGLEVLLRWQHPRFGSLEPTQFLEMAEATDLIIPINEWVIEKSFETLAEWLSQGFDPGRLAINVSAAQFKRSNFVAWLLQQVEKHEIEPHYIEVEITEQAVMEDVNRSLIVLSQLSDAGIKIAIDDFGVGYSSLNYLRRFPVHTLKIDRDFVRDLEMEGGTQELTNAVIAIGKSLHLGVIAEGVETAMQYTYLKEHGCDWVQGHFLSAPLSAGEIMDKYFCNVLEESAETLEIH